MAAYEPTLLQSTLSEEFADNTDEYMRQYIKKLRFVVYHPVGTYRMGTMIDPISVVNPDLRVIRVESGGSGRGCGLRVADDSVMQDITWGNTQVSTVAIRVQMVRILQELYG